MKIRWKQGLEPQQQLDLESFYKDSKVIRGRLTAMLRDIIEEKRAASVASATYDNPNWAYLQADRVGYERAIRDVIELINEKD